jgi:hypothetical protein
VTGSSGERDVALLEGGQRLVEIGFSDDFVRHAVEHARTLDAYVELDLTEAALEVQIVSSADGCSHFIGPFLQLWWWEHPEKPFEELMADNRPKIIKDLNRKIVLPQARAAFEHRYRFLLEQTGVLPDRFIASS